MSIATPMVYLPTSTSLLDVLGEEGRDSVASTTPAETNVTAVYNGVVSSATCTRGGQSSIRVLLALLSSASS